MCIRDRYRSFANPLCPNTGVRIEIGPVPAAAKSLVEADKGVGALGLARRQRVAGRQQLVLRGQQSLKAVSYTHLDVYKRQILAVKMNKIINKECSVVKPHNFR